MLVNVIGNRSSPTNSCCRERKKKKKRKLSTCCKSKTVSRRILSTWQPREDWRVSDSGRGAAGLCLMQFLHTDDASQEQQGHPQRYSLYLHIPTTQVLRPSSFLQHWSGFTRTHSGCERSQYLHRSMSLGTKLLRAPVTAFCCFSQENLPCSRCFPAPARSEVKVAMEERNAMRPHATSRHTVYW